MGFFDFSASNVAVRAKCARELGLYNSRAPGSGEVEFCFRVALSPQWVACREPGVVSRHRAPRSLGALLRQMWSRGVHLGRAYSQTGVRGLFLCSVDRRTGTVTHALEMERPWPLLVWAFLTDLHAANALAVLAVVSLVLGLPLLACPLILGAGFFFYRELAPVWRLRIDVRHKAGLALIHYLANLTLSAASLLGGLRYRTILIPSSILASQSRRAETGREPSLSSMEPQTELLVPDLGIDITCGTELPQSVSVR